MKSVRRCQPPGFVVMLSSIGATMSADVLRRFSGLLITVAVPIANLDTYQRAKATLGAYLRFAEKSNGTDIAMR